MALMSAAPVLSVALHVEESLDFGHHLFVGLFVLLRHTIEEPFFLDPNAHVLHVAIEELRVLLLLTRPLET